MSHMRKQSDRASERLGNLSAISWQVEAGFEFRYAGLSHSAAGTCIHITYRWCVSIWKCRRHSWEVPCGGTESREISLVTSSRS